MLDSKLLRTELDETAAKLARRGLNSTWRLSVLLKNNVSPFK